MTFEIKSDPTACEEFFFLIVESHIVSLAMREFDIELLQSISRGFPQTNTNK